MGLYCLVLGFEDERRLANREKMIECMESLEGFAIYWRVGCVSELTGPGGR